MKISFLLFLFALAQTAQAGEVKSEPFTPDFQGRPIMSLLTNETKEPPMVQVNLMMGRAARICDLQRKPAGSFRSRHAEGVRTKIFTHDGKLAVLERASNGSVSGRLLQIASSESPHVVKTMHCVGVR